MTSVSVIPFPRRLGSDGDKLPPRPRIVELTKPSHRTRFKIKRQATALSHKFAGPTAPRILKAVHSTVKLSKFTRFLSRLIRSFKLIALHVPAYQCLAEIIFRLNFTNNYITAGLGS